MPIVMQTEEDDGPMDSHELLLKYYRFFWDHYWASFPGIPLCILQYITIYIFNLRPDEYWVTVENEPPISGIGEKISADEFASATWNYTVFFWTNIWYFMIGPFFIIFVGITVAVQYYVDKAFMEMFGLSDDSDSTDTTA